MDLPNEADRLPQAVPPHQQHQADTRHVPHKQQRQESVIHLILYSHSKVHWVGHTHLPITKGFSAPLTIQLPVPATGVAKRDIPDATPGNVSPEFAGSYKALRLRRCMRKKTSTPAAIINIAASKIWVIAFSFLLRNTLRAEFLINNSEPPAAALAL
jgi:hypothetical protein